MHRPTKAKNSCLQYERQAHFLGGAKKFGIRNRAQRRALHDIPYNEAARWSVFEMHTRRTEDTR